MLSRLIVIANFKHFKFLTCNINSTGKESLTLENTSNNILAYQKRNKNCFNPNYIFQNHCKINCSMDSYFTEKEKSHRIQEIADQIETVLQPHKCKAWYFIAPKVINDQVVGKLRSALIECMVVSLYADFTKIHEHELLAHCKVRLAQKHNESQKLNAYM